MPRWKATGKSKAAPAPKHAICKSEAAVVMKTDAPSPPQVVAFYSDRPGKKYREFSNFFRDAPPFRFMIPKFAQREGLPQSIDCEFSEKAIMLAKASMMGDEEIFREILKTTVPKDCKELGRRVRGFDQELWDNHLEELAYEVVKQKFDANADLKAVLFSTENAILAEAAPRDSIWGIGMGLNDNGVLDPEKWRGRNVLGYALMRARSYLRGDGASLPAPVGHNRSETDAAECQSSNFSLDFLTVDSDETFLRPVSDLAAVAQCYEKYGVVGVTGVLTSGECQALLTGGVAAFLPKGCNMEDLDTFGLADQAMNKYGVIGKHALFNPAILHARLHPNVVAAYGAVHGREDVFACHDRAAWMRPATINASWDTPFSWPGLHFDISLPSYFGEDASAVEEFLCGVDYSGGQWAAENNAKHHTMGRSVQGVLNLYDNEEEDGGFHCVPGMFGQSLQQWARHHPGLPEAEPNGKYILKGFGVDAQFGDRSVRVPCPAGTLILFDATLPHGTKPNASARSRAILFLRYITSDELPAPAWRNRNSALRHITKQLGFEPNVEQAKHMYGPE